MNLRRLLGPGVSPSYGVDLPTRFLNLHFMNLIVRQLIYIPLRLVQHTVK